MHTSFVHRIRFYMCAGIVVLLLSLSHNTSVKSAPVSSVGGRLPGDTSISAAIQMQVARLHNSLYYPNSVSRLYSAENFKLLWIAPDTVETHAWQAMLLLDCVLQYGLNHNDYHPQDLLYDKLNTFTKQPSGENLAAAIRFDILLSDAMITLMNNLHYGKLNPNYSSKIIDEHKATAFSADARLEDALKQGDFMKLVLSSQPQSTTYRDLQYRLHLLTGTYLDDCYQIPKGEVRLMTINMERLRWAGIDGGPYIQINIPAYTLYFYQPDTTYQFKVIVGKPLTPTATLEGAITNMVTAPERRVPAKIFINEILPNALRDITRLDANQYTIYDIKGQYVTPDITNLRRVQQAARQYYITQSAGCDNSLGLVVFRLQNPFDIYLHDTPQGQLLQKDERALSHGCIRVEHADALAKLILKNDGQANKIAAFAGAFSTHKNKNFELKKPLPVKITYLTCEVKKGELIIYKDIYNMDKSLETALYNSIEPLAKN